LEGSAVLLAWFDPTAPNEDFPAPGQFFVELVSGGKSLTGPILLEDEPMDLMRGPVHWEDPQEPYEAIVGPLTVRGEGEGFTVEYAGRLAKGKIHDLRRAIRWTYMS
jgi:hypothetical protein